MYLVAYMAFSAKLFEVLSIVNNALINQYCPDFISPYSDPCVGYRMYHCWHVSKNVLYINNCLYSRSTLLSKLYIIVKHNIHNNVRLSMQEMSGSHAHLLTHLTSLAYRLVEQSTTHFTVSFFRLIS